MNLVIVPIAMILIGGVFYFYPKGTTEAAANVKEFGRLMMFAGLFAFAFANNTKVL